MKNNLLIIFFPGTGGNHLANLISLSGQYNYAVDLSKYFSDNQQDQHTAHYYQPQATGNTIHWNHFGSNDDELTQTLLQSDNTSFLVIHLPVHNQLAWQRMEKINGVELRKFHFHHDLEKIYKQQDLEKIYPGRWNTVMADELFANHNLDQFFDSLEQKLDITIADRTTAARIHNQWLQNLESTLESTL